MSAPTLAHRLEYLAFRALAGFVRVLPEGLAYALGRGVGRLGALLGVRRGVVAENLARAFPDESEAWRRRVAVDSYRHLGQEMVAMLRLADLTPADIEERIEVPGLPELETELKAGNGALILTGHVGNWEVAGAILASLGAPARAVARRQGNPLFDAYMERVRGRLGLDIIEEGRAFRRVVGELRSGHAVALVADQNVRRKGVFVDFFGVPASTPRGPALFALRSGAPVFFGAALRTGPGRYYGDVVPLKVDRTGDVDEDVRRLTQAYASELERVVRSAPEQYFWHHKRWKTRPPDE